MMLRLFLHPRLAPRLHMIPNLVPGLHHAECQGEVDGGNAVSFIVA